MTRYRTVQTIKAMAPIIFFLSLSFITAHTSYASTGSFYGGDNRYKGFYWFETKMLGNKKDSSIIDKYPPLSAEEASRAIESRKKQLEDARNIMIELSYRDDLPPELLREAIVHYKKLEGRMYNSAIHLVHASEMANFTHPEIADPAKFPTNVFANKIKRKEERQERENIVRQFSKEFDLVIFTDNNCPYSKAFEPVITNFAKNHGFTLDKAALNSSEGKIAQALGINSTPTLIAVSKDAKEMFEISRGMASTSELEDSIILSSKFSREQKIRVHSKYRNLKGKR